MSGQVSMIQRLKETMAQAETSATNFEIDQIAWLIGGFPEKHWLRHHVDNSCPRILALLPEMEPCPGEVQALLRVSHYMNDDTIVGTMADRIRKAVCE